MTKLSVVIPVLNEDAAIGQALARLTPLRARGVEVIVVDGGSGDATIEIARAAADTVIVAPRGRATQMNAGATVSSGDVLLFLHADTQLPADADRRILAELARTEKGWGRFDVRIAGKSMALPLIAAMMNLRSRWTGIATGDQAIFVRRDGFEAVGGYPAIPLMEDIALSKALKRLSPPLCLAARVTTSGRRWDEGGALRTILLMWRLRLAYFMGGAPEMLARRYGYVPREP